MGLVRLGIGAVMEKEDDSLKRPIVCLERIEIQHYNIYWSSGVGLT